jgi:hypothetical protein
MSEHGETWIDLSVLPPGHAAVVAAPLGFFGEATP